MSLSPTSNPLLRRGLANYRELRGMFRLITLTSVLGLLLIAGLTSILDAIDGVHFHSLLKARLAEAVLLGVVTWFGTLTVAALVVGVNMWSRERLTGALPVLALAAYPPRQEILGRFFGVLLLLAEPWLLGGLLVVSVPLVVSPEMAADRHWAGLFGAVLAVWLFCPFWCAAILALAMRCSLESQSTAQALVWFVGVVFALNAFYALAFAGTVHVTRPGGFQMTPLSIVLGSLPPSPLAVLAMISYPLSASTLVLIPLWTVFSAYHLLTAAEEVKHDMQLHARELFVVTLLRNLVPTGQSTCWNYPLESRPKARGWVDSLLFAFHRNPFYAAYRNGFMRLYSNVAAAPGSAWPPGLVFWGVWSFSINSWFNADPSDFTGIGLLLTGLIPAFAISAFEAFSLGHQALMAEREQSTWPLLVVSGLSPRQVLAGKFAAAFYAVSGEWTIPSLLWLVVLTTSQPAAIVLAVLHPTIIAFAILLGLGAACRPLETPWSLRNHPRWLYGAVPLTLAFVAVVATMRDSALARTVIALGRRAEAWLDPLSTLHMLALPAAHDMLLGLARFGTLMACAVLLFVALWSLASWRLRRIMR